MAYDMQKPGEEPGAMAGETAAESIHIPKESLPDSIKEGDCLRCTGMDDSGCTFALEKGDSMEGDGGWESELRKQMSPREPGQEAS